MRKFKSVFALAALALAATTANAQNQVTEIANGIIDGGYNQVNVSYVSESYHSSMRLGNILNAATSGNGGKIDDQFAPSISLQGFGLEYIRGFKVSKKLPMFVEAGLNVNFTFGDSQLSEDGPKLSAQHIGINIPISFAYKFNIKNKFTIKPYAGIDFKISALGRTKDSDDDISAYSRAWEDVDDPFDFDDYDDEDYDEKISNWGNWYSDDYNDPAWKRFNLGWHLGVDFEYRKFNIGLAYTSDITKVCKNDYFKISSNNIAIKLGYTF